MISATTDERWDIDELTPPDAAYRMAQHLAESHNIPLIIGEAASHRTMQAYKGLAETGTVLISPGATSAALREFDRTERAERDQMFFRTISPDSIQSRTLASLALASGKTGVCIVYQVGLYGTNLADLIARGIRNATDMTVQEMPYKGIFELTTRCDEVFAFASTEYAVIVITSSAEEYRVFLDRIRLKCTAKWIGDLTVILPDAGCIRSLFARVPEDDCVLKKIVGTRPIAPHGTRYSDFVSKFDKRFVRSSYAMKAMDSPYCAHAYDATWVGLYGIAYSILKCGEPVGVLVSRGIKQLFTFGGAEVSVGPEDWTRGVHLLRKDEPIKLLGASGDLDWNVESLEFDSPVEVWRLEFSGQNWEIVTDRIDG